MNMDSRLLGNDKWATLQNNYQLAHLRPSVGLDHPVVQAGDYSQTIAADKPPLGVSGGRVAGVFVMTNLSDQIAIE